MAAGKGTASGSTERIQKSQGGTKPHDSDHPVKVGSSERPESHKTEISEMEWVDILPLQSSFCVLGNYNMEKNSAWRPSYYDVSSVTFGWEGLCNGASYQTR